MSIIYEALKKAQEDREDSFIQKMRDDINHSMAEKKKEVVLKRKIGVKVKSFSFTPQAKKYFIFSSIFLSALFLIFIFIGAFKHLPGHKDQNKFSQDFAKPLKQPQSNRSIFQEYILEGIVYGQDSSSAIINGKAVKESERIGEFLVGSISEDKVELVEPEGGTKLTLSLSF
ncbi:MAG: hypothetical protein ABIH08_02050 [Candidatus Omnitrophota bacterium]